MRKPKKEIQLTSYDELLGINEAEQNTLNQIVEVPLNELHPFRNHPFHVNDDEKMAETVESIKNYGILNPALVRPRAEGGYELIAGHRRKRGCELAGKSKMPGMLIVQHMVWTRVSQNRSRRKSTRYYVDEFHLLLNQPQTANYSIEMWKRFRKWGGIITGISQNVTDFLGSLAVESIVGNSDFILMLNQHSGDQKILAEKLNISKHQISFVNNSNAGEGLLFYGNVIIPFADRYPQDTRTYALMSTKPDEIQT